MKLKNEKEKFKEKFKGCVKVYHPTCVGKRNSVLKSEGHWTCPRHSCAECSAPPQFYCLACPDSLCRLCVRAYEFVPVKMNKGLCNTCFELALLAEKNAEFDSEGEKLDFQDPGSDDFMFKDYLLIIMEQEKLVFDDFRHAHSKREKYDKIADKDVVISISDVDSDLDYASDDSLGKKKSRKKRGPKNKVSDILKAHFADTVELSTSDEKENDSESSSENEEEVIISDCKSLRTLSSDKVPLEVRKRPRTLSPDKVPLKEKVEYGARKSCYASIVAEEKVVGSFVRVRRMPGSCSGTTSFQLLQVTGSAVNRKNVKICNKE